MDIKDKEKLENKLVEIANKNLKLQSSYDVDGSYFLVVSKPDITESFTS